MVQKFGKVSECAFLLVVLHKAIQPAKPLRELLHGDVSTLRALMEDHEPLKTMSEFVSGALGRLNSELSHKWGALGKHGAAQTMAAEMAAEMPVDITSST